MNLKAGPNDSTDNGHSKLMKVREKYLLAPFTEYFAKLRVLELAPFSGWFTRFIVNEGAADVQVIELNRWAVKALLRDFSKEILEGKLKIHEADIHTKLYEFASAQFDTVICLGFLYHTPHVIWVLEGMARLQPEFILIETFDGTSFSLAAEKINEPGMRQSDHLCLPFHACVPKKLLVEWMKLLGYEVLREIDKSDAILPLDPEISEFTRDCFKRWVEQYSIWFKKVPLKIGHL